MTSPDNITLLLKILLASRDVLLGLVGGFIAYLFDYNKAKREGNNDFVFRWTSLTINMMLGAYVGYIIGSLIPLDAWYRDAIVSLSGVTAYQILLLAQSRFAGLVFDKVDKIFKK